MLFVKPLELRIIWSKKNSLQKCVVCMIVLFINVPKYLTVPAGQED